ncbi:hypothetical protein ACS2R8_27325, partial [Bacillus cereus group sp. BC6]
KKAREASNFSEYLKREKEITKNNGTKKYSYSKSVLEKAELDPLYHDFPKNLDSDILSNPVITRMDGRIEHLAKGFVNGERGVYH